MILQIILFIVFFIYSFPVWKYRYEFRSMVYQDKSMSINFKPYFVKETIALFSNKYCKTKKDRKLAWFYRVYLLIYILLFVWLINA
jgi:hypothetical protein